MRTHTHSHSHTYVHKRRLSWMLRREPDDSPTPLSVGWGGGSALTQCGWFEVWSLFLPNTHTHTRTHTRTHSHTHRFLSAFCEGSEAPRDDNCVGINRRGTLKCALETSVRPVDCLHFPIRVYTHPTDLQHACKIQTNSTAAKVTFKEECLYPVAKSIHAYIHSLHECVWKETQINVPKKLSKRWSLSSPSSVFPCLVSACSVPIDLTSAYAELLQEKSLTLGLSQ